MWLWTHCTTHSSFWKSVLHDSCPLTCVRRVVLRLMRMLSRIRFSGTDSPSPAHQSFSVRFLHWIRRCLLFGVFLPVNHPLCKADRRRCRPHVTPAVPSSKTAAFTAQDWPQISWGMQVQIRLDHTETNDIIRVLWLAETFLNVLTGMHMQFTPKIVSHLVSFIFFFPKWCLTYIKNKFRPLLNMKDDHRVVFFKIKQWIDLGLLVCVHRCVQGFYIYTHLRGYWG